MAGCTAIPKQCKYCGKKFIAAKSDAFLCSSNCRQASKRKAERIERKRQEKKLLEKGILLKKLTEDRTDLLENLRELKRSSADVLKTFEDSLVEQRPNVIPVMQELILLHFDSMRRLVNYCEDDFLKSELTGDSFNYQIWDALEGRAFEREDETEAYDDDETMV